MDFIDDDHVRRVEFTPQDIEAYENIINDQKNKDLPEFWQKKYRKDQAKNWELFYRRNSTNFFKDRSWLNREFGLAELASLAGEGGGEGWSLVDIGCGVGNAMFPLLNEFPSVRVYGYDVSRRAVELAAERYVKELERCREEKKGLGRVEVLGQWDLIKEDAPSGCLRINHDTLAVEPAEDVRPPLADAGMLLFVLSAIPQDDVEGVIRKIGTLIRPGGLLMFRDYGRYDQKEIRFASRAESRLDNHFYVRQDGTLAVYFDKAKIDELFINVGGFEIVKSEYITRQFTNRKTLQVLNRCWIQATYRRK